MKTSLKLALILAAIINWGDELFAHDNLVVNGGFESGLGGWLGTYGSMIAPDLALEGTRVGVIIDVGHSSTGDPMYQYLPTIAGEHYTFSFHLRSGYGRVGEFPSPGNAPVNVFWDDQFLGVFSNPSTGFWQSHQFETTAASTSTRITFRTDTDTHWQLLDDVRVVPIPEPGILPLLLIAIASLGCWHFGRNPTTIMTHGTIRAR